MAEALHVSGGTPARDAILGAIAAMKKKLKIAAGLSDDHVTDLVVQAEAQEL